MRGIKYFRLDSLIFHELQCLQFDPAKIVSKTKCHIVVRRFIREYLLLDKIAKLGDKFIKLIRFRRRVNILLGSKITMTSKIQNLSQLGITVSQRSRILNQVFDGWWSYLIV